MFRSEGLKNAPAAATGRLSARTYFAQQLAASQQAPEAQQAASQTHAPPLSQAQPNSTHAQFAQLQAAPQQQLAACFPADVSAGAANTAASETVTKPKIAAIDFNMTKFLTERVFKTKSRNTCAHFLDYARSGT